jgi:predicted MFS family arabinose efflux permease
MRETFILISIWLAGMAIAGGGAGINELTSLAATSELAPTRKRGKYVSILVFTIVPFCPCVLWGQLIASHSGWRYVGALCGAYNALGFILTLLFYYPPPRENSKGLSKAEIVSRIDFVGGFLSVSGLILFLAGTQWGGYQVKSPLFVQSIANPRCATFAIMESIKVY